MAAAMPALVFYRAGGVCDVAGPGGAVGVHDASAMAFDADIVSLMLNTWQVPGGARWKHRSDAIVGEEKKTKRTFGFGPSVWTVPTQFLVDKAEFGSVRPRMGLVRLWLAQVESRISACEEEGGEERSVAKKECQGGGGGG